VVNTLWRHPWHVHMIFGLISNYYLFSSQIWSSDALGPEFNASSCSCTLCSHRREKETTRWWLCPFWVSSTVRRTIFPHPHYLVRKQTLLCSWHRGLCLVAEVGWNDVSLGKDPTRVALFHCCCITVPSPSRDNVKALRSRYPANGVVKTSSNIIAVSTAGFCCQRYIGWVHLIFLVLLAKEAMPATSHSVDFTASSPS